MNTADENQVKEQVRRGSKRREKELKDFAKVISNPEGRRVIWRYLEECGVFKTSFTGNSQTFFLEGQRNIGLKILADVNDTSPEAYVIMVKENRNIREEEL